MRRALFRRDDSAVTEVIGYVLSFALSAVFLLIALNLFYTAKGNTEAVVEGVELRSIADRVSGRIVEAGLISQEFPNATMNYTINIPQSLDGKPYKIVAAADKVTASTIDGTLMATSTTFKLEVIAGMTVSGTVQSSSERVIVTYKLAGGSPTIIIHGD